jgi:hypothetical protein
VNRFEVVQHDANPVFLSDQRLADEGIDVVANGSDGVLDESEGFCAVARVCIERVNVAGWDQHIVWELPIRSVSTDQPVRHHLLQCFCHTIAKPSEL